MSVAVVALSWIVPVNDPGSPSALRIQSTTSASISLAAGAVCQSIACPAMALASCSASIDTGAALAGK